MKCADPVLCYTDTKGSRQFRNFRLSNDIYKRMAQQVFSCGKCIFCRKKKAFELAARCVLNASLYEQNCFLTLTYDEKKKGYHNEFNYEDIQKFKKRLRQYVSRTEGKKIAVFNVHEYGRNRKKHWHLIVFNWSPSDKELYTYSKSIPLYVSERVSKLWKHGFITVGDVSEASAMYQSQYMEKDIKHGTRSSDRYKSNSKHSGMGRDYFLAHYRQILSNGWVPYGGRRMPLPRYFYKIAHKHFSHFFEKANFENTKTRRALYTKFKSDDEAKREIAELFIFYKTKRDEYIRELNDEWDQFITEHLQTKEKPDFIKAAENKLHDLRNQQKQEKF